MVEYVIGPAAYLLLGLTALFVLFMPSVLALVFTMLYAVERIRARRKEIALKPPKPPFRVRGSDGWDLIPKLLPSYLLMGVLVILGIATFGGQVVLIAELLLFVATIWCARWWLKLRRVSVEHATAYVLTAWLATRLAWLLWFTLDSGGETTQLFYRPFGGHWDAGVLTNSLLEQPWLPAVALFLAVAAIAAALILSGYERPFLKPVLALTLALPAIGLFWASTPFGFVHLAATMPIVGWVISRETRRMESEGHIQSKSRGGSKLRTASVVVIAAAAALGVASAVRIALAEETAFVPDGVEWILPQVVVVGLAALVLLGISLLLGAWHKYGAMFLGLVWMLVMLVSFEVAGMESWSHIFGYREYVATTIGAAILLWMMWRVFGPGSMRNRGAGDDVEGTEDEI